MGDGAAGLAYYTPMDFVGMNGKTSVGYFEELNKYNGLFLAKSLSINKEKFSHGHSWTGNRLLKTKVMLPINDQDNTDYAYMEEYAKNKRDELISRYKSFVKKQMNGLEYKEIPSLKEKEFESFFIDELFKVSRPKARNKNNYSLGGVPFVASGAMNNGVMECFEPEESESLDKGNCITISPVDGSTFYQPMDFLGRGGAGSSILILRNKDMNLFKGQFIAKMINNTCAKYTYGHMGNQESIKREHILLPVTDLGNPDYEYMEQYTKNLMLKKYMQYLNFLEKQEA